MVFVVDVDGDGNLGCVGLFLCVQGAPAQEMLRKSQRDSVVKAAKAAGAWGSCLAEGI